MSESPDALADFRSALAGRYAIHQELGRGGMAVVYAAEDSRHHRKVAIKVFEPAFASALGAERFLREIDISARLRHPHIVPLYDSGEAAGYLYYVMPLVEGESLRSRLDRERQLTLEDALGIAQEVADALTYAHSQGVVHRDIKPHNILLESGRAMLVDFGIARAIDPVGQEQLTETGLTIGTPVYMSPEQASGSRHLDQRSDLYSLGCVLFEMLAGQPPFTGPTVASVVRQHLTAEPPSIASMRPSVPGPVVAAIERALAKDPVDRFQTIADFAVALTSGELGSRRPRRAMPVIAAAAVTVLMVVLLLRSGVLRPTGVGTPTTTARTATITATLRDAPLQEFVELVSAASGRSFTLAAAAAGTRVTATFQGTAWDLALRSVLETHGLSALEQRAGVIMVHSQEDLASISATAPLRTIVLQWKHGEPGYVVGLLRSVLSGRGAAYPDTVGNTVVLTDIHERIPAESAYVARLDSSVGAAGQ